MRLGTTYISVNDFAKSLAFYQLLLEQEPLYCNDDRWATFDCGNSLSLYNRQFDIDFLVNNDYRGHYNHSYLTTLKNENSDKINTSVIFNFEVEDLISEYERIKKLKIGAVSELLFVNIHMPYWYFTIKDPDVNEIEITGNYNGSDKLTDE